MLRVIRIDPQNEFSVKPEGLRQLAQQKQI
jgi:hypothetical protein